MEKRKHLLAIGIVAVVALGIALAIYLWSGSSEQPGVWYITTIATAQDNHMEFTVDLKEPTDRGKATLREHIAEVINNDTSAPQADLEVGRVYFATTKGGMPAGLPWVILRNSAEDDFKYTLAKERAPRGELRKQVRATELKDLQDLLVENFFVELEVAESERKREDR